MHDMCTVSLPPRPDIRSISRLPRLCDARDRSPGPQVYREYRRKPAHDDGHICVPTWVWLCPHARVWCVGALWVCVSGGVLLSHTLACAVPSALGGLTSGFGMGPGVSLSLWPPEQVRDTKICYLFVFVVVLVCVLGYLIVDASSRCCCCVASPRPISIGQLHTLLCFHVRPIDPVVCRGPYHLDGVGVFILKRASRLDAFSGYHFPT